MLEMKEKGKGQECYNWYHYLWHLIAIGAVKSKKIENLRVPEQEGAYVLEADAWAALETDNPGEGAVVAQIDTGVNDRHPNLAPRIFGAVSFAVHPFGLRYSDPEENWPEMPASDAIPHLRRGPEKMLDASLVSDEMWDRAKRLAKDNPGAAELIQRLKCGRGITQQTPQISRLRYSAHGTACAGLIVGAPPKPTARDGSTASAKPINLDDGDGPISYWGVAPGAKLMPIEISARPDAEQLIMAFLYAWDKKVSVIHFPREVPDPYRSHQHLPGEFEDSRYTSEEAEAAWDYFAILLEAISNEIPIICAAGNDGYDQPIYPACKATGENGIVTVGAVTYRGRRSAYSNYCISNDNGITIAAPSDDQEVYTRHQTRLDREAARWREHDFDLYAGLIENVEFAPQGVFTVDIPGRHGYSGGLLQDIQPASVENRDRASLYTVFGGTSASSAIVAGAVALLQSKYRVKEKRFLTGREVKELLAKAGTTTASWPWLEEGARIKTDNPNGVEEVDPKKQFGAGLLDLRKLLNT